MGIFTHTKIKLLEKSTSAPVTGHNILVKLYDKDLVSDDFLGEATPDPTGNVTITFDLDKIKSADSPLEEYPDLYFQVYKDGNQYFKSTVAEDLDTNEEGNFNFKDGKVIDLGTFMI